MVTIKQINEAFSKGEDLKVRIKYLPKNTVYYIVALPKFKQDDGTWVECIGYSEFSYGAPEYIRVDNQLKDFELL